MEARTSQIGRFLYDFDEPVPISEIKKAINLTPIAIWVLADRMVRYGWLIKTRKGHITFYKLTGFGRETIARIYTYYYGPNWREEIKIK